MPLGDWAVRGPAKNHMSSDPVAVTGSFDVGCSTADSVPQFCVIAPSKFLALVRLANHTD